MPLYDRHKAVDYAVKFAITPSCEYPPFPNDCTSFVSQCMFAGGWTHVGGSFGDRKDDEAWWYGESYFTRASYTWGGAQNFSEFLKKSGRGTLCPRKDLEIGDVVQILDPSKHVFHSMIVTAFMCSSEGDGLHVSYHTDNNLHKFLAEVETRHNAMENSFIYWKIARSF